jgi:hypothetical protein
MVFDSKVFDMKPIMNLFATCTICRAFIRSWNRMRGISLPPKIRSGQVRLPVKPHQGILAETEIR